MKLGIISSRILIRRALAAFLASTGAAFVVMEGTDLHVCLDEVKRSQAEILIVDLCGRDLKELPDLTPLGLVPKVVLLLDDVDNDVFAHAFQLGVWGCLTMRQSPDAFRNILGAAARGERWMPEPVADGVSGELNLKDHPAQDLALELTPREWEVLGLIAHGFRNKEISSRLAISEETAKSHVKSIYRKLKIKSRSEAMLRYFDCIRRLGDKGSVDYLSQAGAPSHVESDNC